VSCGDATLALLQTKVARSLHSIVAGDGVRSLITPPPPFWSSLPLFCSLGFHPSIHRLHLPANSGSLVTEFVNDESAPGPWLWCFSSFSSRR
jgi:hypothetical protein